MADFVENLGFEDTFDLSSTNGFLDHPELIPNGSINTYAQSLHKHFQLSHDNIRLFFLIIATIIILICLIICISICICICLNRYVEYQTKINYCNERSIEIGSMENDGGSIWICFCFRRRNHPHEKPKERRLLTIQTEKINTKKLSVSDEIFFSYKLIREY